MLLAVEPTTWYALAAVVTAAAGLLTSVVALRSSRKQTAEAERLRCEEQLRLLRGENERLASDLHKERMRHEE